MKKLHVRMIDRDDRLIEIVDVDDLERKRTVNYERRVLIVRGKKFIEPAAQDLDVVSTEEWHELVEVLN